MRIQKTIGLVVFVIVLVFLTSASKMMASTVEENKSPNQSSMSQLGLDKPTTIVNNEFVVHDKGLQWLLMANFGELSDPDTRPVDSTPFDAMSSRRTPRLEYPGGSGTVFLYSGGLWVGAVKNGERIVSTVTDGDDGTNEFGPIMGWLYQSKDDGSKEKDDDGDWDVATDDLDGDGDPSSDWDLMRMAMVSSITILNLILMKILLVTFQMIIWTTILTV
jgi:hypothetical protein